MKQCYVSDIRDRLLSPEIVLQVTADDDTPIAVSGVNTTSNQITTGIAHGFVNNQVVSFTSTGTLPAPLAINTPYYVTVVSAQVFTVSLLKGGSAIDLTTAGTGSIAVYSAYLDALIQKYINKSNVWMRDALAVDFQGRIIQIVHTWNAYKAWQVNNAVQRLNRDIRLLQESANLPNLGFIATGTVLDYYFLMSFSMNLHPRTFANYGPPTSGAGGSFAGLALQGDYCIDTFNDMLYVNRGPSTAPVWTQPTVDLALDNLLNAGSGKIASVSVAAGGTGYALNDTGTILSGDSTATYTITGVSGSTVTSVDIVNVGNGYIQGTVALTTGTGTGLTLNIVSLYTNVLLRPAEEYTMFMMAQNGVFRNTADFMNPGGVDVRMNSQSYWAKEAEKSLAKQIPLLRIDLDGDGQISNYEYSLNTAEPAVLG